MEENNKYESKRNHVCCDVTACTYNLDGCACNAPEIDVSGRRAQAIDETCCATFKCKHC